MLVYLTLDVAGNVALSLQDDGRGFDPSLVGIADPPRHFGLRQMRERVVDLGGTLDVHSAKDLGTELIIRLPPMVKEVNPIQNNGASYAAN